MENVTKEKMKKFAVICLYCGSDISHMHLPLATTTLADPIPESTLDNYRGIHQQLREHSDCRDDIVNSIFLGSGNFRPIGSE